LYDQLNRKRTGCVMVDTDRNLSIPAYSGLEIEITKDDEVALSQYDHEQERDNTVIINFIHVPTVIDWLMDRIEHGDIKA